MAIHSSMHAWRIPWTEKPGGLFPGGSDGKASACNAGDLDLIPGSGRSSGEGNGNTLLYSCLENFLNRGVWQATVHGVEKSWARLSDFHYTTAVRICITNSLGCTPETNTTLCINYTPIKKKKRDPSAHPPDPMPCESTVGKESSVSQ